MTCHVQHAMTPPDPCRDVPVLTPEQIREALRKRAAQVDANHEQRERDHLAGLNLVRWNLVLR